MFPVRFRVHYTHIFAFSLPSSLCPDLVVGYSTTLLIAFLLLPPVCGLPLSRLDLGQCTLNHFNLFSCFRVLNPLHYTLKEDISFIFHI